MAKTITVTELAPATSPSATAAAGGSLTASTTYYYKIVALEFTASTLRCQYVTAHSAPTAEVSATTTVSNKTIDLSWTATTKISSSNYLAYLIYRTTTSGDYSNATAKLINAASGDTGYATTPVNAVSYSDAGAITLNKAVIFNSGVPLVEANGGDAGDPITEEDIYQGYVSSSKTAFCTRNTLRFSGADTTYGGIQYAFCGYFRIGYTSVTHAKIRSGREVFIEGKLNFATSAFFYMGSSTSGNGATLGIAGATRDASNGIECTFYIYNSKIYNVNNAADTTGTEGYYGLNLASFNKATGTSATQSIMKDSAWYNYGNNCQISGNISFVNTIMEFYPRLESVGSYVPLLNGISIRGSQLYSYNAPYTLVTSCSMPYIGASTELFFHGSTDRKFIDLVDFTPTYEPPKGTAVTNPGNLTYMRKWSLSVVVKDASNAAIQDVIVSVRDVNSNSSLFTDSGATCTTTMTAAATTMTVSNGTLIPNGSIIKFGTEVMLVTGVATNVLTVTRAQQGTVATVWSSMYSTSKVYIQNTTLNTNSSGTIATQYLTAASYTGNASAAAPYYYDSVAYTPHEIILKKYGYIPFTVTSTISAPQSLTPILATNPYIVAAYATAGAYTGIAIDGSALTVTLTSNHSVQEIYDYAQWWSVQVANLYYTNPVSTADGINFTFAYGFILSGGNVTGTGNINLGAKTLTRTTETSTIDITYGSGANVFTRISLSGLVTNSRVRINNTSDSIEIYNTVVAATSLSVPIVWAANKNLDVRVTYAVGLSAYLPYQSTGSLASNGASFTISQVADTVYNDNAIDGSSITEFATDYPNIQVDISDADGATTVQRLYAWFQYQTHSAQGIVYYFGGITAVDGSNYRVNVSVVNLEIDNVSAAPVKITGAYLYRDNGTTVIYSASNSIQIDPSKAYVANSDTIQSSMLTTSKFLALK